MGSCVLLGACASLLAGCDGRAVRGSRPNVVLISIDCLNERQLEGALAHGALRHIGKLARRGVIFTRAYAQAPWTTPSHMSMMSGLFPNVHGRNVPWRLMLRSNEYYDRVPEFPTLASTLAHAGYETAGFVGNGSISAAYGLGDGFATYHEAPRDAQRSDLPNTVVACRSWLRQRGTRPFFLFLHTYDFHPPRAAGLENDNAALRRIDRLLGRLLTDLRQSGALESALVIVTGDHGSAMQVAPSQCAVHGAGHYAENLHVPLVISFPSGAPSGRNDGLVRHVDLFPTVLDVTGIHDSAYTGVGVSLRRALRAGVFPAFSFSSADARCLKGYGIVTRHYNYIYTPRGEDQVLLRDSSLFLDPSCPRACQALPDVERLFDIDADPRELHNLVGPDMPARTSKALARGRQLMTAMLNRPHRYRIKLALGRRPTVSPELESGLRALGYLE